MTKRPELIAIGDVNVYHRQPSSRRLSPLSSCFKSTSIHPKVKLIMTLKGLLITAQPHGPKIIDPQLKVEISAV